MIRVIYNAEDGCTLPDGKVQDYVDLMIMAHETHKVVFTEENPFTCYIGSGIILTAFRAALKKGKFDKMEVMFNDQVIPVDYEGRLKDWPKGLDDYNEKFLCEILE